MECMYFFVAGKSTKKVRRGLASPLGGCEPLQLSRTSKRKRQIYLTRDHVRLTAINSSSQTKAAVSRCNFREQAREKRQIYLSRDLVRLTAINSISQTKAAVSRCNIREQAREKGKFIFRGTTAYLIAINSSRQTRADVLNTKKKKAAKYRTNEVSGMLCGKTLFFPRFF